MKFSFLTVPTVMFLTACGASVFTPVAMQDKTKTAVKTVKPGAAIDFKYDVTQNLLPSDYGKVMLAFMDGYDSGTLRLSVEADEGLRLVSEISQKEFSMSGDIAHEWELDVTAAQDGIYYLNILATVDLPNGRESGRAFSARIEVGDITSSSARTSIKSNGTLSFDGTTVIMEAEEEIK